MTSDPALDYLHSALAQMRASGADLRASTAALEGLRRSTGRRAAQPAPTLAAPPPAAAAAPKIAAPPAVNLPPPAFAPSLSRGLNPIPSNKAARLAEFGDAVRTCTKCPHLVASRTQVVFGVGNPEAELMFVGEAPGEDEDRQGEPFVGKAGQLLTKIIEAMGLRRSDLYIANVLKCRPDTPGATSGNRRPRTEEMQTCLPYLREQIEIIQPRALVALGAVAMEGLLGQTLPMNKLRGRWHEFNGIPLMATYHPAYLLRNQSLSEKRKVWEDMLLVMERLALPISAKQRGFFLSK